MRGLLEIIVFIIFILFCFYLPGRYLLRKLRLTTDTFFEDIFLTTIMGILFFTLTAYLLSWINMFLLLIPILLFMSYKTFRGKVWLTRKPTKNDGAIILILAIFSFIFSLTMITSGQFGETIKLFGVNNGDGLWHITLINELKEHFPPNIPQFDSIRLVGYHFFYNFLLAKVSTLSTLSPFALLFRFFPLLNAALWSIGVFALMYSWSKKGSVALWAVFLSLFGGSFAFFLLLHGHTGINLDSQFGMHQPAPSLFNPPHAFSILIILASLFAIQKYYITKSNNWLVLLVLSAGLATMFKVYAGIILLGGLCAFTMLELARKRIWPFISLLATIILFLGTYWVFADPSSKLIFLPLWAPHKVLDDNLPWYGYTEKIYTYTRLGVIRGIISTELYALYVFFVGSLGTRLIGIALALFFFLRRKTLPSPFSIILFAMALIAICIPLFFIQSGQVFEIIQLTWFFLFFCALFASFGFGKFFSLRFKKELKILLFVIIIGMTLPSAYETFSRVSLFSRHGDISQEYLNATNFLSQQGKYDDLILQLPDNSYPPTDIAMQQWYSTQPHVIAFANKRGYVQFVNHTFAGVNLTERLNKIKTIVLYTKTEATSSAYPKLKHKVEDVLQKNKIKYIFSSYDPKNISRLKNVKKIFHTDVAVIYKVKTNK